MKDVFARILHLEDGDDDAYFVEQALRGDSILGELRRVENAADFRSALREFEPDLILADFQLPDMDGMEALAMSVELRPDTPFIFVTGYLGEEVAAGTLKEGATDYVLKDRLTRLPSAVRRALREADERRKLATAQASLVRDEHLHRAVAEMTTDFAYSVEIADDRITLEWITGAFSSITGYLADDATTEMLREMVHPDDREQAAERFLSVLQGDVRDVQFRIITRSGEERWLRACARPVLDDQGNLVRVFGAAQDITKLREAAAGLEHLSSLLRSTVEAAGAGILVTDLDGRILYSNDLILEMWGISKERLSTFDRGELLQWSASQVKDPEEYLARGLRRVGETDEIELLDGRIFERTINERRANGKEAGMVVSARDVTQARRTTTLLAESEDRHRELIERIPAVVYEAKPGAARQWSYVSPQIETLLGYAPHEWMGDPELWATCLHPEDRKGVLQAQNEHWAAPQSTPGMDSTVSTEYRLTARDGHEVWIRDEAVIIRDDSGEAITKRGIIVDVTEEKRAEENLRESVAALQRSDDERRRLLDRMFAVQEEERHKIAGDIHDDSVQVMAAAALRLDMLRNKVRDPEQLTMIDRLTTTVRTSIDRLRRLMFELRPPALDREGLAAAVQTYLGRVEEESELDTELENLLTEEPPERVRLVLYRVVQEAMTNARKHSEAALVRVRLEEDHDFVVATITDNGCGFEMGDSLESPAGHLGISAMRERTTQAGGHLSLRTAPGEGTIVEVRLPLDAPGEMPPLAA